jgi:hypothetical protein
MFRRIIIGVVILGGLAAALFAVVWFFQPHPRIDRDVYDMIKPGMTERDLIDLIGAPPGDYGLGKGWPLFDGIGGGDMVVGQSTRQWLGQDVAIVVVLDSSGVVEQALFSDFVIRDYDGHWHRIFCWLRLAEKRPPFAVK